MPYQQLAEKRLSFIKIDQNSISELREAKDILEPAMGEMLDNLYARAFDEAELNSIVCDKVEIDQVCSAQKKHWMEALFNGIYNDAYYERTSKIGRAHTHIGLSPDWYIDSYSQLLCQLIELIYKKYADNGKAAVALIQAVTKIFYLDMDLVMNCYLDAKDESMRRMLQSSTELRVEMWKFSDELNSVAAEIDATAETLSEDTHTHINPTLSDANAHSEDWDEVIKCSEVLLTKAKQLRSQTTDLDEHLKKLPLSEKLYLPEESLVARWKNKLFEKKYHSHRTSLS